MDPPPLPVPDGKRHLDSNFSALNSVIDLAPDEPEVSLEGIEDIGHSITMSSDHPSNVTGHFCDLFVGTHTVHGKVALKRPRIGQQEYTRDDVRVSEWKS